MIGLIRSSYIHLNRTPFRCLFNFLVKPYVEYCFNLVSASQKRWKTDLLENALRRVEKSILGLYDKPYKENLAAMKCFSMKYRRMPGDMILEYKNLRGENQSLRSLFTINESRTRGYNFKHYKPLVQATARTQFLV